MQWPELYKLADTLGFSRPRVVTATLVNTTKFDQHLGKEGLDDDDDDDNEDDDKNDRIKTAAK
jgi:hypothetical protein